jgi:pyruvate,orthophosphate dikinase
MLGLRGCRLGIMYPEITAMQARAIFEPPAPCARKGRVQPEIMVPLVASVVEFRKQALIVRQAAQEVFSEMQISVPFLLGTMIELPRAALTADEIAREAQFFSFGTNDLTQTTWGLSRRRCRALPARLYRQEHHRQRPVPGARRARRRPLIQNGVRDGPEEPGRT